MTEIKKESKIKAPLKLDINKHKAAANFVKGFVAVFRMIFLIAVGYIILYPLFAMIAFSVMSESDILDTSVTWLSKAPTFENYKLAWELLDYPTSLLNTVLVHGISAALEIFSCAIVAYGFARFEFKGKNFLFGLVLFTAIVPVQILVIPLFINFSYFDVLGILKLYFNLTGAEAVYPDLTGTPLTFWLPSIFGVGYRSGIFIFIYRQFFLGLPKELEEASWMDGCGPIRTFFRIVIPSSGVVFLTVTIFSLIWHWNEYYQSVIFFNDNFPLSVKLAAIRETAGALGFEGASLAPSVSAGCLLFIAPMLTVFLVLQKQFIQSIDRVGIVG
jgi:multiple sugar transport system permease protein